MRSPGGPALGLRRLFRDRWRRLAVVGLLCAVAAVLSVASMRRESVTIDEPLNLTAGYTFMKFGDYRLADTNGVLPQRWFALPLLGMKVEAVRARPDGAPIAKQQPPGLGAAGFEPAVPGASHPAAQRLSRPLLPSPSAQQPPAVLAHRRAVRHAFLRSVAD